MKKTNQSARTPILSFIIEDSGIWDKGFHLHKKCEIYSYEFNMDVTQEKTGRPLWMHVEHNMRWDIYTSKTFIQEFTDFIKVKHPEMDIHTIYFSEQGAQQNKLAEMEIVYNS